MRVPPFRAISVFYQVARLNSIVAGHMSAPDNAARSASKSLLRLGRLHMLHKYCEGFIS